MSSKSSSSSSQPSKAAKKNQKKKSKRNKKKNNRQNYSSVTGLMPGGGKLTQCYIDSLNDPFENSGCKLGWGCLVPSTITTVYAKGAVTANADGTLSIGLVPSPGTFVQLADGGAATSFATAAHTLASTDASAINSNFSSGRIISGGIRAYPNLPMTSAPGACYVGAIPSLTVNQYLALTPNDLAASPYMKQFRAYEGGTAVVHPQDTFSFEFDSRNCSTSTTWAGTNDLPSSNPFITFIGIGNGTIVYFEAVINLEVLAISQHNTTGLFSGDQVQSSALSDFWPSKEKMWSAVKEVLASAGRYGAQTALSYAAKSFQGSYGSKSEQMSFGTKGKAYHI